MKYFVFSVIMSVVCFSTVHAETRKINYNKKDFSFGQMVWVNVGLADGVYDDRYIDQNNYLYPHTFRELTRAGFVSCEEHDDWASHRDCTVLIWNPDGTTWLLTSQVTLFLPQQNAILFNF